MASTRTKYDKSSTEVENTQRTKPSIYMLTDGLYESNEKCHPEKGTRHSVTEMARGDRGERAVIEAKLRNSHVPLDGDNETNMDYKNHSEKLSKDNSCKNFNDTNDEYSRFSHPLSDYRGMSTLENHIVPFLHVNNQKVAMKDDFLRKGYSTRLIAKDSHKTKMVTPVNELAIHPQPTDEVPSLPNVTCD